VPISPDMAKVFRDWRDTQTAPRESGPVLPWPHDDYNSLYEDWHAIQTTAGMPEGDHYVPKDCRSTCASALIAANVPTVVVKDFLGHATVATTENYYINTKPALRAAATARKVRLEDGEAGKDEPADGHSADAKGGPNEKL
jgi:integrase